MAKDPHEPFDKVTMTGEDGVEHDITNAFNGDHQPFNLDGDGQEILFAESASEREQREAFYKTTPNRRKERVDAYVHSIKVSGSLRLEEALRNCDHVSVTIADIDGTVIATDMAEVTVAFKKHVTKDATIMERVHSAKVES